MHCLRETENACSNNTTGKGRLVCSPSVVDTWHIDSDKYIFRCSAYIHPKAKNIFAHRKDCNKPKKDDLMKNEMSRAHNQSTLVPKQQLAFATARVTANDHARLAIITQFRTMLTQAKRCLPIVKNVAYINA